MEGGTTCPDALKRQQKLTAQMISTGNDIRGRRIHPMKNKRFPTQNDTTLTSPAKFSIAPLQEQQQSLNITELEEENTIHMASTPNKYSFEPKEFAARSTMARAQHEQPHTRGSSNDQNYVSVEIEEILAASFADNIRSMGKSLRKNAADGIEMEHNADISLPRTADMSKFSRPSVGSITSGDENGGVVGKDGWDLSQQAFDNSWMKAKMNELSQMEDFSFRSGENMESKLLEDEIEWEQENAVIPLANAKARQASPVGATRKPQLTKHVDFSCFSGYLAQENNISQSCAGDSENEDNSYCSVGQYFNKMSDDLKSMIGDHSPPRRTPLPLLDVTNDAMGKDGHGISEKADKENSLSVSCIAKAITSMDLEDSPHNFIYKLKQVQRMKTEPHFSSTVGHTMSGCQYQSDKISYKLPECGRWMKTMDSKFTQKSYPSEQQVIQNVPLGQQLSDTISCSDSMINCFSTDSEIPIVKISSPMKTEVDRNISFKRVSSETVTDRIKQTLIDTYCVPTATKLSDAQIGLPLIPTVCGTSKICQKNILKTKEDNADNCCGMQIFKQNRKRSCSAIPLGDGKDKRSELFTQMKPILHPRSRSSSNRAELRAVCSAEALQMSSMRRDCGKYRSTQTRLQCSAVYEKSFADGQKSFLSPELDQNRSPCSSQKANTLARGYEVTDKNSMFPPISRSSSQCSGSTEWTHRGDGSLPLKATHSELSWGSTRLRRSEKRTLQIKNTSDRKILLKAIIAGPGFQLYSVEHQRAPEVLTLRSQECRTITVDFCPTIIGPAVGVLSFHPHNDLHAQRIVSLYGYGGEASVKIEGIQKGPGGPYLELGNACHLGRPLEKSFSLYNKGNLPAFARIDIDRKSLDQALLASVVYVHPQRTVIAPNSYAHIKVVFKPGRQEISKILQKQVEVLSVTNLHILWGDEPTRHRIRRNIAMVKSKEVNDPKLEAMTYICNPFSEEEELAGLDLFAEHLFDTIHELFLTFREYELVLTIDRALDDTMLDLSMADDEFGALFKTMYATTEVGSPSGRLPVSNNCQLSPPGGSGTQALGILKRESGESWSVRPTALEFQASVERMKQFVIKSNFYTSQYFELNCNYRQLFRLSPSEGHIRPGQEVVVTASLQDVNSTGLHQQDIFFVVYIENEKISVPVSIYNGKI